MDEDGEKIKQAYNYLAYPEDIKERKELRVFKETFNQYDPVKKPDIGEDWENEEPRP